MTRLWLIAGMAVALATPAGAQTLSSWGRGSQLAVTGGVAHDGTDTRAVLGGAAAWELTTFFAVEGTGRWIDHRHHDAFAGELSALIGLGGSRDTAVPYLAVGVGLHRRTFEVTPAALDGVPGFYRRRLGEPAALGVRRSFTDPTLVAGVGVDIALSRTVVVRPDVRTLFVVNGGRHATVMVASVSLGYRFERKFVTPSRR
ncbi:MAG: hypothetical protein AB7U83_17185 [Vicinamibacterales bacterium]